MSDNSGRIQQLRAQFSGLADRLVIISGPSAGAGKGRVIDELMQKASEPLWLSVSMTTRQPRPGEVLHHTYTFVDREEFEQLEAKGAFLEANGVTAGQRYGTPLQPILDHLSAGDIVLLEIEVNGASFVHQVVPEALFLFIKPTDGGLEEDIAELRRRLVKRGTENEALMERRLEQAKGELALARKLGFYNEWIVNATGKSQETAGRIHELIRARLKR